MLIKNNNNFWISLFLVGLIALIYSFVKIQKNNAFDSILDKNEIVNKFSFGDIELYKDGENWWLKKGEVTQPAETNLVDSFVKRLRQLEFDKKISENKDRFSEFGITSDSTKFVISGKTFLIGHLGDRYESSFVKPEKVDAVFELPVVWGDGGPAKIDYWVEKLATNISYSQITKVVASGNEIKKDENFLKKIAYIEKGKYLGGVVPTPESKVVFEVYVGEDKNIVEIGKYWVKSGNYYYQIKQDDFDVLTSVLKKS